MRSPAKINKKGNLMLHGIEVSWAHDEASFREKILPDVKGPMVGMAGLGLGNDVLACLDLDIDILIVIEKEQSIIDLFYERYPYLQEDPRLEIVLGSYPDITVTWADTFIYSIDTYKIL